VKAFFLRNTQKRKKMKNKKMRDPTNQRPRAIAGE